jgi:hypothetical protein
MYQQLCCCWHSSQLYLDTLDIPVTNYAAGRAMTQVVSHRPLTTEARVRAWVNPCGICGGQSGTGTGFSPSSSVFPSIYHSIIALQTHIIWGMRNMLT